MNLLTNVSTTTTSALVQGFGSERQIIISATTWNGGNVALFTSYDKTTWVPLQYNFSDAIFSDNLSFTAPKISSSAYIQAVFTQGDGAAVDVNVWWG